MKIFCVFDPDIVLVTVGTLSPLYSFPVATVTNYHKLKTENLLSNSSGG